MKKFFISSRPKQILKNTVLFIPLFFTLNSWINLDINKIQVLFTNSFFAFLVFICCSIIGYQINDLIDKNYDKKHEIKKNRPIVAIATILPPRDSILFGFFLTSIENLFI